MFPDRVSNPGPLTYESDALPIALRGPAGKIRHIGGRCAAKVKYHLMKSVKLNFYKPNKSSQSV